MASVVLTLLGTDRAGLVSAVSRVVTDHEGSWAHSQMAHLAGMFAGIVEVELPPARIDGLIAAVEALAEQGLRVTVEHSGDSATPEARERMDLHLVGADRPGIVAEVSELLACRDANVEQLITKVIEAPMAGGTLFEAEAVIALPADSDAAGLRRALEALADELMVDLNLYDGA